MTPTDSLANLPGDKSHAESAPEGPSASQLRHAADSTQGAEERLAPTDADDSRQSPPRRRIEISLGQQKPQEDARDDDRKHDASPYTPPAEPSSPAAPPSFRGASLQAAIARTAREVEHLKGTQKALSDALTAISDDDDVAPGMRDSLQARLNTTTTMVTRKSVQLGTLRASAGGHRVSSTLEVQSNLANGLLQAATEGVAAAAGVSPLDALMEDTAPGVPQPQSTPDNDQRLAALSEGVFAAFRLSFVNAGCQGGSTLTATARALGVQQVTPPVAAAPRQACTDPSPFDFPPPMAPRPPKDGRRR